MNGRMINMRARQAMPGNWGTAIVIVFLIQVIQGTVSSLFQIPIFLARFMNTVRLMEAGGQGFSFGEQGMPNIVFETRDLYQFSILGLVSAIVLALLSTVFSAYQAYAFQAPIRGRKLTIEEGVNSMRETGVMRAVKTALRVMIFSFLWSLLFVIPGIVKSYAYSQALYLVRDRRNMTPREALQESQDLMRGRKGMLFGLHLRYMVLPLLIIIVMITLGAIGVTMLVMENMTGFLFFLPIFLGILALIILSYYIGVMIQVVNAAFYETLLEETGRKQIYTDSRARYEA